MSHSNVSTQNGAIYRLSKREKEWVTESNDPSAALLCIRYALVYTKRSPEWLLEECLPEVKYTSQLVDKQHHGLDEVDQLFKKRMTDPVWYPESGDLPLIELATMPDGRPCGLLVKRKSRFDSGLGRPDFWMTFSADSHGKIVSIQSGCLPSPLALNRSGIFPGISAARLKLAKARQPAVIPAGVPLRFLYVHNQNDPDWLPSAEAAKDALRYFNMATLEVIPIELDPSQQSDVVWLSKKGVLALPHLHIICGGEDVLRLDGPFDQKHLMSELYKRFYPPGSSNIEPGIVKELIENDTPGMEDAEKIQWLYYSDPLRIEEILAAFQGDNLLAAQRAAYILDRLSFIKKDVIQPYAALLIGTSHEDSNIGKLRHVARMLTRLTLNSSELLRAEQLLLNLSWQRKDAALQIFALKSLRHFAKTNFRLREYAGQFVYNLMRRARNGRVMREAEQTLDTIEYFDEQTHEQWDRLQAHA